MPKKKLPPSDNVWEEKRRFHWFLYQKPKAYPSRPISNKKDMLKPIRHSRAVNSLFIEPSTSKQ